MKTPGRRSGNSLRRKYIRRGATAALASSIAVLSMTNATPAQAMTASEIVAIPIDVILLRPLSFIRLTVGALFYTPAMVVTAPMAVIEGNYSEINVINETFILDPIDYTFFRPIGKYLEGQ
jgi:hypothetical protein